MAPKKEKAQKLTLGEFIGADSYGGSWADEVEDTYASGTQPLPPRQSGSGYGSGYGGGNDRGYSSIRENLPQQIPDKPPYTLHLGNLSYDATQETVTEFFEGCNIVSVRIIEDREQQRPKGFAYAEFGDREGLVKALTLDGQSFQSRSIRIKVADPPKERRDGGFDSGRDLSNASWERKGPLAALPGSERPGRSDYSERRAPREPMADDGKVRDFGNWERRGPLSPLAQPERTGGRSRDGSRPGTNDGRSDNFRNRHASPAWGPGEGRGEPREPRLDGSRPPRREFSDRPERAPTAAEQDNQWRTHMRPDAPVKSESNSRAGSEAPSSPAGGAPATLAGGRPKLNLIKRTVSEQPAATSPASSAADSKASPFGAARPIDTAAREREIEEKRLAAIKEKKEADDKAKEERRLAKEAAAKEAAEKAAAEEAAKEAAKNAPEEAPKEAAPEAAKETPEVAETDKPEEAKDTATEAVAAPATAPAQNGEQKVPVRTREPREPREPRGPRGEPRGDDFSKPQTRATESGNWRSASGEQRGGPRGGGAPRAPRGGGVPRGPRNDGGRPPRANGAAPAQSTPAAAGEPEAPKTDEDGWTTVAPPVKGRRGGRPIVS
ncbi:RNA-binding domain-containing protein [Coniochaeta ligniaria NRRL 30616]|uniref:RNA-binding domain-containing protein n=1 Tax=Coniochaeta ligniaria NRRL 30616 TaxID=1408157 RepID=A0A1J7JTL8_9PEZI|nr:RNA-binding domain-containing protein [Coniochaeta ligniaria NRRL 30616]